MEKWIISKCTQLGPFSERTPNSRLASFTDHRYECQLHASTLNQYTAVGSVSPRYDGNGNLTYDGTFTYCYDAENRLTSVLTAGTCASPTTTVASYAYDAHNYGDSALN